MYGDVLFHELIPGRVPRNNSIIKAVDNLMEMNDGNHPYPVSDLNA
jgi:hypothetical protein